MVLPSPFFRTRLLTHPNHSLDTLLSVIQWIGSKYTSTTKLDSDVLYNSAILSAQNAPTSPFNVQALALLALAQHHDSKRDEARKSLDGAVEMAIALGMNDKAFAGVHGEGDAVLEESWRRTWFVLYGVDLEFSVAARRLTFGLGEVGWNVDLPCDDSEYESGVSYHEDAVVR